MKKYDKNEGENWEIYGVNKYLAQTLEKNGYYLPFNYFKQNWKRSKAEKDLFISYFIEETEYKNVFVVISCLNSLKLDLFNVQCLIVFPDDAKALEFYEIFTNLTRKMNNLKTGLILEENKIIDDRECLTKGNSQIIIGSAKKIDYVIKKHFLNVFLIKNLMLDLICEKEGFYRKEVYEEILNTMPEDAKKVLFYEENQFFKKKFMKKLEQIL